METQNKQPVQAEPVPEPVPEPVKQPGQEQQPPEENLSVSLSMDEINTLGYYISPQRIKIETYADLVMAEKAIKLFQGLVEGAETLKKE